MSASAIHRVYKGPKSAFSTAFLTEAHLTELMGSCVRGALAAFDERPKGVKLHVWVDWHIRLALRLAKKYSGVPSTREFMDGADDEFRLQVVPALVSEAGHVLKTRRDRDEAWREDVTGPSIAPPAREDGRAVFVAPETVMAPASARWTVDDMLKQMDS